MPAEEAGARQPPSDAPYPGAAFDRAFDEDDRLINLPFFLPPFSL